MNRPSPPPLEIILGISAEANSEYARDLMMLLREAVHDNEDWEPWGTAVLVARDLGALERAPACYLLDIVTEIAVGELTGSDPTLVALAEQMQTIERLDGLGEDDAYSLDQAPPEWRVVNDRWDRRFEQLRARLLERLGEPELARMCRLRPDEFEELSQEGWAALMSVPEDDD